MSWDYYLVITCDGQVSKVKASSKKLLELQPDIAANRIKVLWSDGDEVFDYDAKLDEWSPLDLSR